MENGDKIKQIIKDEYHAAFSEGALKTFEYDHRKLAENYPEGSKAYFNLQLYKLKEEYLSSKYGYYLRNWIRCDCFDFAYLEGFEHLLNHCRKTFVNLLEGDAGDFAKGRFESDVKIDWLYDHNWKYIRAIVKEFYTGASKVCSITNMMVEDPQEERGLTLWDLFIDKSVAEKVKQKLIVDGRIRMEKGVSIFVPSKSNSRYEPESLRQALSFLQLIDTKIELTQPEIVKMFKNTFHGFSCTARTLTSEGMSDKVNYYMTICKLA